MDCAAREGIQFSHSNGVRRLLPARGLKKPTILVVDDEVASGQVLSVRLKLAGFRSSFVSSGEQALGILAGSHVDAVLSDLKMPGFSGLCSGDQGWGRRLSPQARRGQRCIEESTAGLGQETG
jgi:PleD family two-component response regulator